MRRALALVLGISLLVIGLTACQPVDAAPVRLTVYYGWFGGPGGYGWHQQGYDHYSRYHSTLGEYDARDVNTVKTQIAWMRYAGIDAAAASWWGQGSFTDQSFHAQMQAAAGRPGDFHWTMYYELQGQTVAQIRDNLAYIKANYANNTDVWLYQNGRPVIVVYNSHDIGCQVTQKWHDAAAGWYVVLKVFDGWQSCGNQPDGWHQYGPASGYDAHLPITASVSPGFWWVPEAQPRLVRDPARFEADARRMRDSGAKWQIISTWNEMGEGSGVEPTVEYGTAYIDALHAVFGQ